MVDCHIVVYGTQDEYYTRLVLLSLAYSLYTHSHTFSRNWDSWIYVIRSMHNRKTETTKKELENKIKTIAASK